jgi:hypothetical protein
VPKRVLILSSTRSKVDVLELKAHLELDGTVEVTPWFKVLGGGWLLDHVVTMIQDFPYVIVLLSKRDTLASEGASGSRSRGNLLMEVGMALATNGPDRTFLVREVEKRSLLPTNMAGWLHYRYRKRATHSKDALTLREVAARIMVEVKKHDSVMSWGRLFREIVSIGSWCFDSGHDAWQPNVVVAVNMGGNIPGSLLYYKHRGLFHLMTLWTKEESPYRGLLWRDRDFARELRSVLGGMVERDGKRANARILLIDDSDKNGEAMNQALRLVKTTLARMAGIKHTVRRAALVFRGDPEVAPEYRGPHDYDCLPYARI